MRHILAFSIALLASCLVLAQTASDATREQAAIVDFAQQAAVRALDFNQGDLGSLMDARDDFTSEGWSEFVKHMEGWTDKNGAPTFSSNFVASGNAVVIGQEQHLIHLKIPGTLTQTQNQSKTTYSHFEVDIRAGGKPIKITHLEQIYKGH
jgi:hypothetical protein